MAAPLMSSTRPLSVADVIVCCARTCGQRPPPSDNSSPNEIELRMNWPRLLLKKEIMIYVSFENCALVRSIETRSARTSRLRALERAIADLRKTLCVPMAFMLAHALHGA
jgi:hypothetical protein